MKKPIITLDDGTEVIDTTGDTDAFKYGGGVLYRDARRKNYYWQFWNARERGQKNYLVYMAPVPENVLEFFDPDFQELCEISELTRNEIKRMSRSKNVRERLRLIEEIREICGPSAVDPENGAEELTPWELSARWGVLFGSSPETISQIDFEDYIIRENANNEYECGCIDGTFLGRYEKYKHALCAIADRMHETGDLNVNVFHEHEIGQLELVHWDSASFVGKLASRRCKMSSTVWKVSIRHYTSAEIRRKGIARRRASEKGILKQREQAAKRNAGKQRAERFRKLVERT